MLRLAITILCCLWLQTSNQSELFADTIELKNGRKVAGEILEDAAGQPLLFRYSVSGKWKTRRVDRDTIERYTREPGNQSDTAEVLDSALVTGPNDVTQRTMQRLITASLPAAPPEGGEVVILSLEGTYGFATLQTIGEGISSVDFSLMLKAAMARNPALVVLLIHSGGGNKSVMDRIVEKLIDAQSEPTNLRIVAWVDLGGSAAALTTLACKEIVVFPTARIGAATTITEDGNARPPPASARDQKLLSMEDARRRQMADLTGHPLEVYEAIEFPSRLLWAHPEKGFSLTEPMGEGWTQLDTEESRPLTLSASELVQFGLAKGVAGDVATLLEVVSLPQDTSVEIIDLRSESFQKLISPLKNAAIEEYQQFDDALEKYQKQLENLKENLLLARRALGVIDNATDGYSTAELNALRDALKRCRTPRISSTDRKLLEKYDLDQLELYDKCFAEIRQNISRASRTLSQQGDYALPITALGADIKSAYTWAGIVLGEVYGPLEE